MWILKASLGIILIVVGMFAGASAAASYFTAEARRIPPEKQFVQTAGGAVCSLFVVALGISLTLSGGKKSKYRQSVERFRQ